MRDYDEVHHIDTACATTTKISDVASTSEGGVAFDAEGNIVVANGRREGVNLHVSTSHIACACRIGNTHQCVSSKRRTISYIRQGPFAPSTGHGVQPENRPSVCCRFYS